MNNVKSCKDYNMSMSKKKDNLRIGSKLCPSALQVICSSSASQFVASPASAHNSDHEELNFGFKGKRL